MPRIVIAVLLYGCLNAIAYSCLLPLWEGFDEGYHYGYVRYVSQEKSPPVLGQTTLSREVWRAYELAPVSHYLQPFTHAPLNFTDYFNLPEETRKELRQKLESLRADRFEPQPDKQNYEANQPPLPYLPLGAVDWLLRGASLPVRVLWVRLFSSLCAVAMIAHSTLLLSREISLGPGYASAALFCIFSSQMLYAVISHVCNDWLAIPVMIYFLWAGVRAWNRGAPRDWSLLAVALAAALLTKAYFLFIIPLALGIAVLAWTRKRVDARRLAIFLAVFALLAAPWYVRNLVLYRNLAGTVEQMSGVSLSQLLGSVWSFPWIRSSYELAHASLWTGNNSFTTFSSMTLNIALTLLAICLFGNLRTTHWTPAQWIVAAGAALFAAGLAFVGLTFYVGSKGAVNAAMPWYPQVLLGPVFLLVFLGVQSAGRWRRWLQGAMVLLWGYILAATYLLKLAPMYGGYVHSHGRISDLWQWYSGGQRDAMLRTICLAPPGLIWCCIAAIAIVDAALCAFFIARRPDSPGKPA